MTTFLVDLDGDEIDVLLAIGGGQSVSAVAANLIREALAERRRPYDELALAYEALARAAAAAGDESRALHYVGLAHDARASSSKLGG